MFCKNCGTLFDDSASFCPNCGTPAEKPEAVEQEVNQEVNQAPVNEGQTPPVYTPPVTPPEYNANQYTPNGPAKPVSFGQRNIALCIVLSLVTCGVYGIYWMIKIVDELNEANDDQNATSGTMVFLLSLVTCSIYLWYWMYKAGENVNKAKAARGLPVESDSSILYMLLTIFGFGIVSWALIQNELNKIAEFHGAPKA